MDSMVSEKSVMISINDIFDELMVENKRLLNELLFANQWKRLLMKFQEKYKTLIDCEDNQEINEWTQRYHQLIHKTSGDRSQWLTVDDTIESIDCKLKT